MIKRFLVATLFLIVIISSFTGCSFNKGNTSKKIIAVSIAPQVTFVEKVCEDKFEVVNIIPSGASPETYEPTPADVQKLEDAEIYFAIGVPAEDGKILSFVDKEKCVSLQNAAKKSYSELYTDGGRDPHIWLSPKRVIEMIAEIEKTLCELDPENADLYKQNSKEYILELQSTDTQIHNIFKNKKVKRFIMFHPSFGYFADDYGLEMLALEQDGKEVNAKRMAELATLAKKQGINEIFYQAEASQKQAQAFAEQIDGQAICLEPLSADYCNNLLKTAELISKAVE